LAKATVCVRDEECLFFDVQSCLRIRETDCLISGCEELHPVCRARALTLFICCGFGLCVSCYCVSLYLFFCFILSSVLAGACRFERVADASVPFMGSFASSFREPMVPFRTSAQPCLEFSPFNRICLSASVFSCGGWCDSIAFICKFPSWFLSDSAGKGLFGTSSFFFSLSSFLLFSAAERMTGVP